jgi:hypothetical protein
MLWIPGRGIPVRCTKQFLNPVLQQRVEGGGLGESFQAGLSEMYLKGKIFVAFFGTREWFHNTIITFRAHHD